MAAAVELDHLTKSYGSVRAVDALSLELEQGETVALLGPNGAGKTTTISLLLGLLRPDEGRVSLFGHTPTKAVAEGRVGAMLQEGGLLGGVGVAELLGMLAGLYPNPRPVEEVLAMAQLDGLAGRRTDRLSGGQAQRLRLAVALVANPDLLVLDEPTAAMDVEARRRFWRTMGEQAEQGTTILFSTHYLEEADEYADRVVVIGLGKILADGTPASLKASVGAKAVRFVAAGADHRALSRLPGVTGVEIRGHRVELRSGEPEATVREALSQWPDLRDLEVGGIGLEDAFVALTAH
ncbi:MAG: ABC transporter ATP-binding protein [Acidimicrobiales bacterium]